MTDAYPVYMSVVLWVVLGPKIHMYMYMYMCT